MRPVTIFRLILACTMIVVFGCDKPADEDTIPVVTGISPMAGGNGSTVYITGSGFSSLKDSSGCVRVYFQNKQACAAVRNNDTLEVLVPFDAGDGPICVRYNGRSYCTAQSFNYLQGNPGPNSFMRLADCPNAPTNQVAAMGATDDAIIAGFINWWRYDIDKNTWADMPAPVDKFTRMASFTYKGKAYFFGGYRSGFSNRLQCYDPVSNSWSFRAPMPSTPRSDAAAFVWNDKVYIAGGIDNFSYNGNTVFKQLWQYDPVTDSWVRKADLPLGAGEGSYALRIGQKFYVPSGGYGVQEYDPQTNTWVQFDAASYLPLYAACFSDKSFALGYTVGGSAGNPGTGIVKRYAINYPGNRLSIEDYGQPTGYNTVGAPFYAVVNNELYYGLSYQTVNGIQVRDNQFWRYRY